MAYDRVEIFEQAKKETEAKKLIWIDEIIAFIPCSKSTFYDFFPDKSDELEELKALIELNRIQLKTSLRKKWYDSDAPALQMGLMKLLGTDEEAHRLNGSKTENKTSLKVNLSDEDVTFE